MLRSTPSVFFVFFVKNAKKNVSLRGGTTKQSAKLLPIPSPQKRVIARRNDEAICQVNHENPFFDLFHNVNLTKNILRKWADCFVVPPRKDTLILCFKFV
jgi:hypothetical protein